MDLATFRVGSLEVSPGLVLAPMSGVTDAAFRRLVRECSPGAVGLVVSEFVSIEGLTRRDLKTLRMLRYDPGEHPIGIQIFGADVDRMAEAAAMVQETGVDLVDVNCGCPVPKVVKRGGGADLLRRPDHLEKILRAVRREISVPLTLKIRIGWDESTINGVEVAQMAEAAGVEMLTVHGRTRVQLYTGAADWDRIGEVKRSVSIPVVGSGDVVSIATARSRLDRSRVDGIAIGRGAMENPWIFSLVAADLRGDPSSPPTVSQRFAALRRYRELLDEAYPEKVTSARLRGMACRIARGFPGCGALREAVSRTRRSDELLDVVARFEDGQPLAAEAPVPPSTTADSAWSVA
ncbi:MAG: tRNA dihydrouridine synthase DusB [Alphaproteobacteria bacterium]